MGLLRAVLPAPPVQAHVHLAFDELEGHGVKLLVHADVVVESDCGDLPNRQLEGVARQGQKHDPFFPEPGCPGAVFLLERLMVKGVQPFADGFVELPQREEFLVADHRKDEAGDVPDRALDGRLVLRRAHPRGHDRRAVMLRQLLVRLVEHKLRPRVFDHAGLKVIRHQHQRHAPK